MGALRRSLGESQEQQAATSEILSVISSSPTDIGPVLDAIAASATTVCGAYDALVLLCAKAISRGGQRIMGH